MHTFWRASYTFGSLVCDILIVILGRSGEHGAPVSPNTLNSYGVSGYQFVHSIHYWTHLRLMSAQHQTTLVQYFHFIKSLIEVVLELTVHSRVQSFVNTEATMERSFSCFTCIYLN